MFKRTDTKDVFDRLVDSDDTGPEAVDRIETRTADDRDDKDTAAVAVEDEPDRQDTAGEPTPEAEEESESTTVSADTGRGRRIARRLLVVGMVIAFVAACVLAAFFGWQFKQLDDSADAGHAALEVARNYAVTLTSVDYQKVDENFAQVLDGATGEFKDMYGQSAAQLRQLLIDNKAVSHGSVIDAAIKSATPSKVEVLIFVDQSISNTVNPEPRIDRSRVGVTMELVDDRWLASKVEIK